jgi:Rrf2 family protein
MALALNYGHGTMMVREIAEAHMLPATYLEQIMVPLRKSGVVSATRGAGGGYVLARPPADTTVLEIIEILEGPLVLVECETVRTCCTTPDCCALKALIDDAADALRQVFGDMTLAELAEQQRRKMAGAALMYDI